MRRKDGKVMCVLQRKRGGDRDSREKMKGMTSGGRAGIDSITPSLACLPIALQINGAGLFHLFMINSVSIYVTLHQNAHSLAKIIFPTNGISNHGDVESVPAHSKPPYVLTYAVPLKPQHSVNL